MNNFFVKIIEKSVLFYRKYLKIPFFSKSRCRFYPTCSEYMLNSVHKHGAFKGFLKGLYRLLRCNPFSKGGYDPVK